MVGGPLSALGCQIVLRRGTSRACDYRIRPCALPKTTVPSPNGPNPAARALGVRAEHDNAEVVGRCGLDARPPTVGKSRGGEALDEDRIIGDIRGPAIEHDGPGRT